MRTLRRDRLPLVPRSLLDLLNRRDDWRFSSVRFIRNQIASEDFEDVFRCSHNRRHVQTNMDRTRQQALLSDLITSQTNSEERSDDRNGLDESFGDAPTPSPEYSAFY